MSTNKISKVQLNDILYSLKGDANNIKEVMSSIISDLYSRIDTGSDNTTILDIIERLSNVEEGKASLEQIEELWELINNLSGKIPNSTINYFFAYKISSEAPDRPANTEEYPPQGWKSYPESPSSDEVVYMTTARKVNNSWQNWADGYRWTLPIAYSEKPQLTLSIESNIALYKLSLDVPELSDKQRRTPSYPQGWTTTPNFSTLGDKDVYMITAKMVNGNYVLQNNYYWSSPMRIGDGTTSGTGVDGDTYNYVYYPSNSSDAPSIPTFTVLLIEDLNSIGGWHDTPLGVNENRMYEYISLSIGNDKNRNTWSSPVLWSKWGERGMDGDSVEYIYKLTTTQANNPSNLIQNYSLEFIDSNVYLTDDFCPNDWTDNPSGVNSLYPYEYVAIRKKTNGEWLRFSTPALWAKYGKDGVLGNLGISGAVLRYRGIWADILDFNGVARQSATFEYNSHSDSGNINYIDVVYDGTNYYQCKEQHIINPGSSGPTLSNDRYWQIAEQFKFIITETLIADYISSNTVSANDVIIKEGEGNDMSIVAGMTSSKAKHSTLGDVRIWAGTDSTNLNILDAPFIVNNKGELYARNANINGKFHATSGTFNGDVEAQSLSIKDGDKVIMLFKPAPDNLVDENNNPIGVTAGTPMLFVYYNGEEYVYNMTKLSTGSNTTTTLSPKLVYVLNNNGYDSISSLITALTNSLKLLHRLDHPNALKMYYYLAEGTNHWTSNIPVKTTLTTIYKASSTDDTINNKYFTGSSTNSLPFTGYCLTEKIIAKLDYSPTSSNYTMLAVYCVEYYENGIKVILAGDKNRNYWCVIGTWHVENSSVVNSDFADIGVSQLYTAPSYANDPHVPSYKDLLPTEYQVDDGVNPHPGAIS